MLGDHEAERADEAEGGPVKTFLEHLEDFRWVLIKSVVTLFLAMLVCLFAANYIIQIIKWPLTRAPVGYRGTNQVVIVSFGTNHVGNFRLSPEQRQSLNLGTNRFVAVTVEPITVGTNRVLGWRVNDNSQAIADAQRVNIELINLSPAGGFVVAFQVAIYGGAVLASPFIFYFIAAFVFPALKLRERKYVYRGLIIGVGLFLTGVSFCYFILMPVALAAAQMYSRWLGLGALQWRAEDYISFVCKFMLGMGLGFELPVVVLTLVKIGVLNYHTLSKARRYMIVINLFLGAVLTTPEVITQIVMFVPLQLLYEITVWIAWYWERRDKKRALHPLDLP
ncbi:MAG: twin-arginine translocase subunit TatC [Verrucomicrobiota bacterium]|jgi:sec-independent protein translocase protein TatC